MLYKLASRSKPCRFRGSGLSGLNKAMPRQMRGYKLLCLCKITAWQGPKKLLPDPTRFGEFDSGFHPGSNMFTNFHLGKTSAVVGSGFYDLPRSALAKAETIVTKSRDKRLQN